MIALSPVWVMTVVVAFGVDSVEPPATAVKPLIPASAVPDGLAATRHVVARRTSRHRTDDVAVSLKIQCSPN